MENKIKNAISKGKREKEGENVLSEKTKEAAQSLGQSLRPGCRREGIALEKNYIPEMLKKAKETLEIRKSNPTFRKSCMEKNEVLEKFIEKFQN